MTSLNGKTVFLTGAAAGIGRAIAIQLAAEGCHLFLVDVDADGLQSLKDQLVGHTACVWTCTCDLADADSVAQALAAADEAIDVIDVVINNAGVAYYGPTDTMTPEQWDWLMSINLLAPIRITNHFLPRLIQRPEPHIVNVCSIAGLVASGRTSAYNTSKFGLLGYTESLRAEYGRRGVGVTAVCPGPVLTNLYEVAKSSREGARVPTPPAWASVTPHQVASRTVAAMRRNKAQLLITPMAHVVSRLKRYFPRTLDFVTQFSRKKRRRKQERLRLEAERLARTERSDQEKTRRAA